MTAVLCVLGGLRGHPHLNDLNIITNHPISRGQLDQPERASPLCPAMLLGRISRGATRFGTGPMTGRAAGKRFGGTSWKAGSAGRAREKVERPQDALP